jgi:hypothetical protein
MNEKLIPKGIYCDGCPYFSYLKIFDDEETPIYVPYCIYLKKGSISDNWKNNEFDRLKTLFNLTEDEMFEHELFELSLLFDGCKECGINSEYDESELF